MSNNLNSASSAWPSSSRPTASLTNFFHQWVKFTGDMSASNLESNSQVGFFDVIVVQEFLAGTLKA